MCQAQKVRGPFQVVEFKARKLAESCLELRMAAWCWQRVIGYQSIGTSRWKLSETGEGIPGKEFLSIRVGDRAAF